MKNFLTVIFGAIYQCFIIGGMVLAIMFAIGMFVYGYCTDIVSKICFGGIILCIGVEILHKAQELAEFIMYVIERRKDKKGSEK